MGSWFFGGSPWGWVPVSIFLLTLVASIVFWRSYLRHRESNIHWAYLVITPIVVALDGLVVLANVVWSLVAFVLRLTFS